MPDGQFFDASAYGRDPFEKPLPPQNWDQIVLLANRWARGTEAMSEWAEQARRCVDYFEGKQWSDTDLAKLRLEKRPALTLNRIKPLVMLVLGYFLNNRTDIGYLPASDGTGIAAIAETLTNLAKDIDERNQVRYVDTERYLDGLLTGRGFIDHRMDFETNAFGDVKKKAKDPFSIILDPDGETYDPAEWQFVFEQRWTDMDEIEHFYGRQAARIVSPFITGNGIVGDLPGTYTSSDMEFLAPWRGFGGNLANSRYPFAKGFSWQDWVDPYRKTVRLLDAQHYVRTWRWHFCDLETGDRSPVPDNWTADRVQRAIQFAAQNGQQIMLQQLSVKRLRWTHMIGDTIVFDDWSPYETPTIVPFFPYFRRGRTKGMVEDLLDPQDEVNVRRSARLNIIGRTANSGWMVQKGSVDPRMMQEMRTGGGRPGLVVEWDGKGGALNAPQQITMPNNTTPTRELEHEAQSDLEYIAGINKAALGQQDSANASGRALLARQNQTVVGLELFQDNYHRSKRLDAKKTLEMVQKFYTNTRIIRVEGENKMNPVSMTINQVTAQGIVNNVSLGRYDVVLDDSSLEDSFLAAQFQELMQMREVGIPIPPEFLIDASTVPRKDELKLKLLAAQSMAPPPADGGGEAPAPGATPAATSAEPGGPPPIAPANLNRGQP
jgi:hypothetical protein